MIAIYTAKLTADLAMQFNRQPIDEQRVRLTEATQAAAEATRRFLAARDEWMRGHTFDADSIP